MPVRKLKKVVLRKRKSKTIRLDDWRKNESAKKNNEGLKRNGTLENSNTKLMRPNWKLNCYVKKSYRIQKV